ncbi:NUDIX domain-containing protein [Gordonibacter sp. 28C]|uniref:NUDIX domain-containing protein n=1 Tax=Gordonibacter sp. 28C TaxID=2078569 RepID=UPI001314FC3F|nr:NUDIX domain-containing protein [Gordonibacter sp. 28C]
MPTVVIAGVIEKKGKVLLARRGPGRPHAGLWEFPGGKIEEGETEQRCLERELKEELGLLGRARRFIAQSRCVCEDGSEILLRALLFEPHTLDDLELRVHDRYEWTDLSSLELKELAPADIEIAEKTKDFFLNFKTTFEVGKIVTGAEIEEEFLCSLQSGMCRSRRTGTLCLISKHSTDVVYEDRWEDDVLYYTGMGQVGDQKMDRQNLTLKESQTNGVQVHLFEFFENVGYLYRGRVHLIDEPFREHQKDREGNVRLVWVFPLELMESDGAVPEKFIKETFEKRDRRARKKTNEELASLVSEGTGKASRRRAISEEYVRDPHVAEYAKRRAHGVCQLCGKAAPFKRPNGEAYLECHHVEWLSRGGTDSVQNTVALCPNCHRKMHVLDSDEDRAALLEKAQEDL